MRESGKKEIYEVHQGFLLMRLGTILSGLVSGTAVTAKARIRFSSPLHAYSVQAEGSNCAEVRGLIGVLLDSKVANLDLKVQLFCPPV